MTQSSSQGLQDYIKRLGEHINLVYDRLKKIEARMNEMSKEIDDIKELADVDRREFNDFVTGLTESVRELLPPLPEEAREAVEQPPQEKTEPPRS